DCSIQRRHQKVLEETPAPHFPKEWKEKMAEMAVRCGSSISYLGAGTVEFILGGDGSFYFLEMNTRLQVEHPITEMVTGLDLVELQIRIAEGNSIPEPLLDLDAVPQNGHAMEVRIYAEDPENEFLPSTGKIEWMHVPTGQGVRFDSGVTTGSNVSIYYDPMIGKLIVHAENRNACLKKMAQVLSETIVFGPKTNIDFLSRLVQEEDFEKGLVSTHFLEGREHLTRKDNQEVSKAIALAMNLSQFKKDSDSVWKVVGNAFSI
ncbi:MAG: biotin carboxylase, partial [Leptospira sp.]|nr:biotin carboxylase [Leptospira sp.]